MGGSSKSNTTNVTTTTSKNLNLSDAENSNLLDSGGGNIEILDAGAVDRAFEFGRNSLTSNEDNFSELLDFGQSISSQGQAANQAALDTVTAAITGDQRTSSTNAGLIRNAIIAAVVISGLFFASKAFRG